MPVLRYLKTYGFTGVCAAELLRRRSKLRGATIGRCEPVREVTNTADPLHRRLESLGGKVQLLAIVR